MIFAHGPLGFLCSWIAKPLQKKFSFSKKTMYVLWGVGILGGIFPDADLFYYYIVDATASHRALFTHTPITYVLLLLVGGLITWLLKKYAWFAAVLVFSVGALSHVLFDMIVSQVRVFSPLSESYFGVVGLGIELVNANLLFINFLIEGIICFFFFYVLIRVFSKKASTRIIATALLITVFTAGVAAITYGNNHVYHAPYNNRYADNDSDGVVNYQDDDIDGDGVINSIDTDSDGDGKLNAQEVIEHSERFFGVWYDVTNGRLIQIPSRLGFVSNDDIIKLLYDGIGVPITIEMSTDYEQNPQGYESPPADASFGRNKKNIYSWLDHTDRLEAGDELAAGRNNLGDILFFSSGHAGIVTGVDQNGQILILDVHKDRSVQERYLNEIISFEGEVVARGKMIDPSAVLQQ